MTGEEGTATPGSDVKRILDAHEAVLDAARPESVASQHERGKLTARERLDLLFDDDVLEFGPLVTPDDLAIADAAPGDGVVAAMGDVDGRTVSALATDFTVFGGSMGDVGMRKIKSMVERSLRRGIPLVMLVDGGGHRIQEIDARPYAFGNDTGPFLQQAQLSGWSPQVAAVMGPAYAGAALLTSFADFVPMVRGTGSVGIAGPKLVRAGLGENVSLEELGGATVQAQNGVVDVVVEDDEACIASIRSYLGFLPSNAEHAPPRGSRKDPWDRSAPELRDIVPSNPRRAYDVRDVMRPIVDDEYLFELQADHARNIVVALARVDGMPIGLIGNQPAYMAGTIDAAAAEKATRFLETCNAFGLPIVSLIDTPGVLIGRQAEAQKLLRHAAKPLAVLAHATVPVVTITLRKAFGAGFIAMGGGRENTDASVIWPTAVMSPMGIEGAVEVAFHRQVASADDPDAARAELLERFYEKTTPLRAASGYGVDDVCDPAMTRSWLVRALRTARGRRRPTAPAKRHWITPT